MEVKNQELFHPRASHKAVNVDGSVYIYGGYMLNTKNAKDLVRFNTEKEEFEAVDVKVNNGTMKSRYDHSMVYHDVSYYIHLPYCFRKAFLFIIFSMPYMFMVE